ncbi:MAG: molybdopterin adenylyltransferase, partial [Desulfobacterales bacterium]
FKAAILTVSDRGSSGERDDASGPALAQWLEDKGITIVATEVVPDEKKIISSRLMEWSDKGFCELILTTGGTGVSPRDVTPDATSEILDKTIPGFGEIMRRKGTEKTPMAIISRATAGVRKQSLIVNLPGSPKAALENIESIWDAVPHTIEKMLGDTRDCGSDH